VSAITDLRTGYVLDRLLLPAGAVLVVLTAISGNAPSALVGAAVAASAPAAIHFATRGRGMGLGDVKLAALLGSATDASGALEILAVSFISGGIAAISLLAIGKRCSDTLPFAPFLCFGICAIAVKTLL
jgi:leader peptidase (prepilin peptidase)/N-methyltransferase